MPFKTIDANQPINVVMLGCGYAAVKHSRTLAGFKGVKCYYASRSLAKAVQFNERFKGAGHFGSYEEAIQSDKVDVVMVLTPPVQHLKLTLTAIEHGKHVIVEKPPFLNSADFDLVKEAQLKSGVQVMVAENYFYKPVLKPLRKMLGSGIIGEVKFIVLNATKKQYTGNWRDDIALAGGGALFEGGIHWINFMGQLGYQIHSVRGIFPGESTGMERSAQVVFKYTEGAVGTLLYSWEVDALFRGLRISRAFGTKGSLIFESNGLFIFARGKRLKLVFPGLRDISGYKAMFADFTEALRKGREPLFNLNQARRDLELIEIILEDANEDI